MKAKSLAGSVCFAVIASVAHATPMLSVGIPGDSMLSKPSSASPVLGGTILNFDSLAPYSTFSNYTSNGVSISSADGFTVLPFSTQSGPNELYDSSADGSANVTISLAYGHTAIAFGIADSDPVSLTIQAIGANGALLGSPFVENLASTESSVNTGNGYYVVQDTTSDIFGLQLTELLGSSDFSGLALDDVQVAPTPEPSTVTLMGLGMFSILALTSFRRLKQA